MAATPRASGSVGGQSSFSRLREARPWQRPPGRVYVNNRPFDVDGMPPAVHEAIDQIAESLGPGYHGDVFFVDRPEAAMVMSELPVEQAFEFEYTPDTGSFQIKFYMFNEDAARGYADARRANEAIFSALPTALGAAGITGMDSEVLARLRVSGVRTEEYYQYSDELRRPHRIGYLSQATYEARVVGLRLFAGLYTAVYAAIMTQIPERGIDSTASRRAWIDTEEVEYSCSTYDRRFSDARIAALAQLRAKAVFEAHALGLAVLGYKATEADESDGGYRLRYSSGRGKGRAYASAVAPGGGAEANSDPPSEMRISLPLAPGIMHKRAVVRAVFSTAVDTYLQK